MGLIRWNTRMARIVGFVIGLSLAYIGYRQIPFGAEPTLGVAVESLESSLGQIIGTTMLIVGSFLASVSTVLEGIYAYRGWSKNRHWLHILNLVFAVLLLILVAYLTWPGFEWALAATVVIVLAILVNRLVKEQEY